MRGKGEKWRSAQRPTYSRLKAVLKEMWTGGRQEPQGSLSLFFCKGKGGGATPTLCQLVFECHVNSAAGSQMNNRTNHLFRTSIGHPPCTSETKVGHTGSSCKRASASGIQRSEIKYGSEPLDGKIQQLCAVAKADMLSVSSDPTHA